MTEITTTDGKSNRIRWFTAAIIGLMIVLMVFSSNTLNQAAHGQHGVLIGTSNAGDVMSQDTQYATRLLDQLGTVYVVIPPSTEAGQEQVVPLLTACWGEILPRDLKSHPEALALALRESRKMSPGVSPMALGPLEAEKQSSEAVGLFNSGRVQMDDLRPLPTSPLGQMRARLSQSYPLELRVVRRNNEGRPVELAPSSLPPLDQGNLYAVMHDFLTIQAAASLSLSSVKATTPMIDRFLAQQFQTFTLQLGTIDARPLLAKLPEPTDDQLRAQFTKYAGDVGGRVSATNPFGFGYRVGDRVKLELISYKRADVQKAVEAEKTPYEWEVAARIAYAKDPSAFKPTTQPTTVPTTAPSTFEAMKAAVVAATIDKAVDQRSAEIEKAIRSPMAMDYQLWLSASNRATAATAPAAPAVAANADAKIAYDAPEYLHALAASIEKTQKVKLGVELYTDQFRDGNQLGLIGGFNDATRELPPDLARRAGRFNELITGPEYAISFSKDLLEPVAVEFLGALVLERYRPSERIESRRGVEGRDREVFFFRITASERNHPGTDLETIRDKVKSDWRIAEAQKQAMDEAKTAAAAITAGTDFDVALNTAAPGSPVFRTDVGPFHSAPPEGGGVLGLSMPAYAQFGLQLTDQLLGDGVTVAALDVPLGGKAYVAQRVAVKSEWQSEDDLRSLRQALRARYTAQMILPKTDSNPVGLASDDLASSWLNPKLVTERFAYKAARNDDASKE